ncbi:MAG: hypothetical protein R3F20_14105 [Planctomycetota bacterium]
MRLLDIDWLATRWPTENVPGYGEQPMPLSGLANSNAGDKRPFLVFIEEEETGDELKDLIIDLFGSEDVVVASRTFNCYHLKAEDIPDTTLRKKYGSTTPAIYFFGADGKETGKVTGRKNSKAVFRQMKKAFDDHYDVRLTKWVDRFLDQLVVIEKAEDAVANQKKAVETIQDRIAAKDKANKKLEEDLAEAQKELEAADKAFADACKALDDMLEIPTKKESATARK